MTFSKSWEEHREWSAIHSTMNYQLYETLHISTTGLRLQAGIKTRERGPFTDCLLAGVIESRASERAVKSCGFLRPAVFFFFHLVSRWEREGWRPPRPPLHPGQRTHMITWLWTWTRSCQTLFGPRGQNRVWQETCWKVRKQPCTCKVRNHTVISAVLCKFLVLICWGLLCCGFTQASRGVKRTEEERIWKKKEKKWKKGGGERSVVCNSEPAFLPPQSFFFPFFFFSDSAPARSHRGIHTCDTNRHQTRHCTQTKTDADVDVPFQY